MHYVILLILSLASCKSIDNNQLDIVGGVESSKFPQVGILSYKGRMHCTASLIAEKRIVTAAHCIEAKQEDAAEVFAFHIGETLENSQSFSIESATIHPSYDPIDSNFDIAYLDLKESPKVALTSILEETIEPIIGEELFILGYGRLLSPSDFGDPGSGIKREATIQVSEINATKIKAQATGISSCNGDSGGPAFLKRQGELQLAGIVSCGDANCKSYGVYTRVSAFQNFLGLRTQADPDYEPDRCEGANPLGVCKDDLLVLCKQDCFEATKQEIDCKASLGGSCYLTKTENRAVCIDESWEKFDFQLKKLRNTGNKLEAEAAKSIEVFINQTDVDASSQSGLSTDLQGRFSESLPAGENTFQVKYAYSSKNIAVSFPRALLREDKIINEIYMGDTPVRLSTQLELSQNQSLYITGSSKLFEDWKKAYKFRRDENYWHFEDILTEQLEYKLVLAESEEDEISTENVVWEKGENRRLGSIKIFYGIEEKITPPRF